MGIALYAFGWELPVRVSAVADYLDNGAIYHVTGQLVFANNRTALIEGGYGGPLRQVLEVGGQKGVIRVDDFVNPPKGCTSSFEGPSTAPPQRYTIVNDDRGVWGCGKEEEVILEDCKDIHEVEMFTNFAKAIKEGQQEDLWVKTSLLTMLTLDALHKSTKSDGAFVTL